MAKLRTSATGLLIALTVALVCITGTMASHAQEFANPFTAGCERIQGQAGVEDFFVVTVNGLPVIGILHKGSFPDLEARAVDTKDLLQEGLNEMYRNALRDTDASFEGAKVMVSEGWDWVKLGNTSVIRVVPGDGVAFARLDEYKSERNVDAKLVAGYWRTFLHDALLLLNGQEPLPLSVDYPECAVLGDIYQRAKDNIPEEASALVTVSTIKAAATEEDVTKLRELVLAVPRGFQTPEHLPPIHVGVSKPPPPPPPEEPEVSEPVDLSFIWPLAILALVIIAAVLWSRKAYVVKLYAYRADDYEFKLVDYAAEEYKKEGTPAVLPYGRELALPLFDLLVFLFRKKPDDVELATRIIGPASPLKIRLKLADASKPKQEDIKLSDASRQYPLFKIVYRTSVKKNVFTKRVNVEFVLISDNWDEIKGAFHRMQL